MTDVSIIGLNYFPQFEIKLTEEAKYYLKNDIDSFIDIYGEFFVFKTVDGKVFDAALSISHPD